MTAALITAVVVLVLVVLALGAERFRLGSASAPTAPADGSRRILFPYLPRALSVRALDAALRLAHAEDATLVPVFLAKVALDLPLDTPLPRQAAICLPLQEAIEQRASIVGIPVDARIERGRTYRHALRQAIDHERFERIVVAAATHGGAGFEAEDVAWLLDNAPGEIVVLRPGTSDQVIQVPARAKKRSIGPLSRRGTRNPSRKTVFTT